MSFPRRTPPLGMSGRSATGWTRAVVVGTATRTGSSRARDEEDSRAKTSSSSRRERRKRFSRAGDGSTRRARLGRGRVVLGAGRVRGVDSDTARRSAAARACVAPPARSRTRSSRPSPRAPPPTAPSPRARRADRAMRELSAVDCRGRARHPTRWRAEAGDTSGAWASVRACLTQWLPSFASNETLTSEALATRRGVGVLPPRAARPVRRLTPNSGNSPPCRRAATDDACRPRPAVHGRSARRRRRRHAGGARAKTGTRRASGGSCSPLPAPPRGGA